MGVFYLNPPFYLAHESTFIWFYTFVPNKRVGYTVSGPKIQKKALKRVVFPLRSMCGLALGVYGWVPVFKRGPLAVPWQGLLERADCFFLHLSGSREPYGGSFI